MTTSPHTEQFGGRSEKCVQSLVLPLSVWCLKSLIIPMLCIISGYCKTEQENVLERGLPNSQNKMKQNVWETVRFIVITYFTGKQDNYMKEKILMQKLNTRTLYTTKFFCLFLGLQRKENNLANQRTLQMWQKQPSLKLASGHVVLER